MWSLRVPTLGRERLREADLHAGVVDQGFGRVVRLADLDLNGLKLEAGGGAAAGVFFIVGDLAASGLATVGELRARVVAVDVLFHQHPQAGEGVGAAIGVGDDLIVAQDLGGGVELRMHLVVGFVLPVARAGCAVARSIDVHRVGQGKRREGGARVVAAVAA